MTQSGKGLKDGKAGEGSAPEADAAQRRDFGADPDADTKPTRRNGAPAPSRPRESSSPG